MSSITFTKLTALAAGPHAETHREVRWLWDGYLAAGLVTLLTSRWKTGKTTLVSLLLARIGAGRRAGPRAVARHGP